MPVPCRNLFLALLCACASLAVPAAHAGVSGSISGTVKDVTGAVIAGAAVTATNAETGARQAVVTGADGVYTFSVLAVGRYTLDVVKADFQPYSRTGVVIDVNSALTENVVLQLGRRTDTVIVSDSSVHVESSSTQMGEVISGAKLASAPLNGRSYTDLLALQPGVAPATSITAATVQDVGASAFSPSGDLNPGTISVNGQREFANGFEVNGSDVEEDVNMGTAIIPNLDSIAEFRILTNNFDAEYGEFSGGQINVVTKSGTNAFHGDLFEFVRNTDLDARNYFSPTRAAFRQNQFGGTFGGPLVRNQVFFFADYQGTRQTQGVDTGLIPVPSIQDRSGNLADAADLFVATGANGDSTPTVVSGPYWAGLLAQKLGYTVTAGEPYYTPGCRTSSQCVFPDAVLPRKAWSLPAQYLLQYIPPPNVGAGQFSTSAFNETLRDDKGAFRLDANTRAGALSAYYFADDFTQNNPYPTAQGGANVPGFNALNLGRAQLLSLGDTKTLGHTAVNELHFSFMRDTNDLGRPVGGLGVSLASQGFATGPGTSGIVALSPSTEGVEGVTFNNLSIGTNTNQLRQANNTFQGIDNFSKLVGAHTLKFGAEFHYDQINTFPIAQFNGSFLFFGSETGSDFADFLLGTPSQYNQSQLQSFYGRNKYAGIYAQDSWHARPSLTLNYGLRWDRIEPWYEKYNQLAVFETGRQSIVFPAAPAGILFPTDPGVPPTLASPGNFDFAPRVGLAYSPSPKSEFWNKLFGSSGDTAVRAGFGMFYTAIEALSIAVSSANAPYGTTYTSPAPPLFATPFIAAATGQGSQYFPVQLASLNSSANHPDRSVNWSQFEPISGLPAYDTANRIPYTEEYMLSLERKFGGNTLLTASYVGSQAHRLLVLVESNPGNPALCLSLSQPGDVAPGTPTCGPFGESNLYTTASGRAIHGTRGPLGPNFGSDTNQSTIGNSSYNSFQLSLRHTAGRLELLAGYTFSKSLDQSSNLGEEVNPLNPALSKALSAFDVAQNFVVSYSYRLPLDRIFKPNRLTREWVLSGITHFSTGFPVTLYNFGDNSLLGASPNGINNFGLDEPQYTPGPLELNQNPRNGKSYFNPALFSLQPLGTPGNAKRRFFFGPGVNNYDMALLKYLPITESKNLEFRLEAFNIFNHAQFDGPASVDGNINSASFAQVVSAAAPRLVQAAIKFNF
jgi:Carboxypeptidase regulatory-like domain